MQSGLNEIIWSPIFENYFLAWSTKLQLYQVENLQGNESLINSNTTLKLSDKTCANLVSTNSEHQYIKCVSWYLGSKNDDPLSQIVAVGQANGRIALSNFANSLDIQNLIGKEFVPKISRPVNAVTWNRHFCQYLAAGFDKAGKDHSIYIIDANKGVSISNNDDRNFNKCEHLQTAYEWSVGETVHSLEFSRNDPQILLGGINNRQIKVFDFRQSKSINSVTTKAVYGLSADPFNLTRFASFVDNIVNIWDMRNLERPILTLTDNGNRNIWKISWCFTRYGLLSVLCRDSHSVCLYDIQEQGTKIEDADPAVITRSFPAKSKNVVTSFSWHPTNTNRILIAYNTGEVDDKIVRERITLNFTVTNSLVWSSGMNSLHYSDQMSPIADHQDVSILMKSRAVRGYGLEFSKLSQNGDVTADPVLERLWIWMEQATKLAHDSSFKPASIGQYQYQGVLNLLTNGGALKSDAVLRQWIGIEGSKIAAAKLYTSEERTSCLCLCSWDFKKEGDLRRYLDSLETAKQYARAVAIAVFNLLIPKAIKILQAGASTLADPSFNTTAIALAGFTSERTALWRDTCSSLLPSISDPYIRTAFAFLASESDDYKDILNEENMNVHDRIAFACKYLNDSALLDFLQRLKTELLNKGNLDGIILTGLHSSEGHELMQRYIDITGDIQTPALLIIHTKSSIDLDDRLQCWLENYFGFLDSLQLWKERASIDVLRPADGSRQATPPVYVACSFCLKSISGATQQFGKIRNPYNRFGSAAANKLKITACPNPNCRRPLPRCSLCLHHMGTPSKRGSVVSRNVPTDDSMIPLGESHLHANLNRPLHLKRFSNWFSWCQQCQHGGHVGHISEWFSEHLECPVSSCSCKCMSIDSI